MEFEWDRSKAAQNRKKHRVAFEEAVTVFYDPMAATFDDPEHSADELRFVTIGYSSHDRLLVVVHAESGVNTRIISARLANAKERKNHET